MKKLSLSTNIIYPILLILFFLSGACGLVYEIIWQRMLWLVFGNTTFATATILSSFMGGLALGSFYLGRIADRYKSPLKLYAYLEAGIGIFAILFPFIVPWITNVYISIARHFYPTSYFSSFVKFVLCFSVLLIPTFLMGGTLPVISKFFIKRSQQLGKEIGNLYGVNTFGAVIGCIFTGFFLIYHLGIRQTTYLAASLNILIAVSILVVGKFLKLDGKNPLDITEKEEKKNSESTIYPDYVFRLVLIVYAFSGFCALAYEVLWTRVLVFFLHSNTYAFSIMLSSFLCGIALGSFLSAKYIDRQKNPLVILGLIEILIGLLAICTIWEFPRIQIVAKTLFTSFGQTGIVRPLSKFGGCFLIMFLPTLLMGMAFPVASKIYIRSLKKVGSSIGNVYGINTLGCIAGSLIAGFCLIPLIGITNSIIVIGSLNLLLGVSVISFHPFIKPHLKLIITGITILFMVTLGSIIFQQPVNILTRLGFAKDGRLIFYKEGTAGTVAVRQKFCAYPPEKPLEIDGIPVADIDPVMMTDSKMLGHLPFLLHPEAKSALTVGFGSGGTSWSMLQHKLDEVTAVELLPEIIEASHYFPECHPNTMFEDPRLKLVINDARNFLLATEENYDVITTDCTDLAYQANSSLYSKEYFELCKKRLNPSGVMAVWTPATPILREEFKTLLKTFLTVFPHTTLWYMNNCPSHYVILIGTEESLQVDFERFKSMFNNENVKNDLAKIQLANPYKVLSCLVMDEKTLSYYVGEVPTHTDNYPYLELLIQSRFDFDKEFLYENFRQDISKFSPDFLTIVKNLSSNDKNELDRFFRAAPYIISGDVFVREGKFKNSIDEYFKALALNSGDETILQLLKYSKYYQLIEEATVQRRNKELLRALQTCKKAIMIAPEYIPAYNISGGLYVLLGQFQEAIIQFKEVLKINAECPVTHYNLAVVYENMGLTNESQQELQKALKLDPSFKIVWEETQR